jgi:hypothetical protein
MTFRETIDSLIDVMQVPEEKRCGEGYETARKEIHDNLATIEDVTAVCYHEAAHLIYANLVAFMYKVSAAKFAIVGPQITYHSATDDRPERYESTSTAIRTPGLQARIPRTSEGLMDAATIAVAGGESVSHFSSKKNKSMWKRGDYDDKGRFKYFADDVRNRVGPVMIEPYIVYWQNATEKVREDFARETYVSDIEREAQHAMKNVFPPVFSST